MRIASTTEHKQQTRKAILAPNKNAIPRPNNQYLPGKIRLCCALITYEHVELSNLVAFAEPANKFQQKAHVSPRSMALGQRIIQ